MVFTVSFVFLAFGLVFPLSRTTTIWESEPKTTTTFLPLGVLPGATPTTWRKLCLNFGGMGCRTLKVKQMNVKHVKLRLTIGNAVKRDRGQSSAWLGYAQRAVCCCNTSRFISWLNVCESRKQSWRFNSTPCSYITRGPKANAEGCHVSQIESLGH